MVQGVTTPRPVLDLVARYDDIRRLVCAHPSFRAAVSAGYDPDDLLQVVLLQVLEYQRGPSRWAPERGSLSKYLWVLTWTTLAKHTRKGRRHHEQDSVGLEDEPSHDLRTLEEQLRDACHDLGLTAEQVGLAMDVASGHRRRGWKVNVLRALVRLRASGGGRGRG